MLDAGCWMLDAGGWRLEAGGGNWGNRGVQVAGLREGSGGTGGSGFHYQAFKLLYKNPPEIPSGIPS